MLSLRSGLSVLGSLLISQVLSQNETCHSMQPKNYSQPIYSTPQPFVPFFAPNVTQFFDDSDTSGAITYKGRWTNVMGPGAINSTLHVTNDTSASVSFTFTGTGIEWFGTTGKDHGIANVTLHSTPPIEAEVDGSSADPYEQQRLWAGIEWFGTTGKDHGIAKITIDSTPTIEVEVDGWSAEQYEQQRLWSKLELPLGNYTLTIQNTACSRPGHRLDVNGFVVTTKPSYVVPGGRVSHADGWSLVQKGSSGVSGMQLVVVSPTHALIFDKVEHNYASIEGHPAWSVLYDLNTNDLRPLDLKSNSFCASGSFLSNGTFFGLGGTSAFVNNTSHREYHDFDGLQSLRIFEPCLGQSEHCSVLDMVNASSVPRWYPTTLRITDGSALVIGGGKGIVFLNNSTTNQPSVSFFPSRPSSPAKFDFPFLNRTLNANLFPHAFSLPNRRAFIIANTLSVFYNWGASPPVEETTYPLPNGVRVTYPMGGTALLLPLSSQDNYTSRIIVCGGSEVFDMLCDFQYSSKEPASNQCSRIEIKRDGTTEGWKVDDSMPDGARITPDSVLLPTGEVVILNGARSGFMGIASVIDAVGESNADNPALSPIVYSPDNQPGHRFRKLVVKSDIARLYHSVATLTPNGDVMITGSNSGNDRILIEYPTEYSVEWLSPPYMKADRPTYTGLRAVIGYGTKFPLEVQIPSSLDSSKIKISLMDFGFSTHSTHTNTRLVYLDASLCGNRLTVTAPPDAGIYPPGPGYIFVVVDNVPSKAMITLIGDGKAPVPH